MLHHTSSVTKILKLMFYFSLMILNTFLLLVQYGLGARYEHGQLPRLRVALELYTPLPELHTVFLDLCDNSTATDAKYDLTMKYGPTKHLQISVDMKVKMFAKDLHYIFSLLLSFEISLSTL